jgi:hypothetical protein
MRSPVVSGSVSNHLECLFCGTQQGEWAGVPGTGRKMEVAAAPFFLSMATALSVSACTSILQLVLKQLAAIP